MTSDDEQDPWARFKKLPEHERFLIQALKGVEAQQQEIRYQYQLEVLELNKKYAGLLDPLYDRRKAIVTGDSLPNETDLRAGEKGLRKVLGKEFQPQPPTRRPLANNGILNFWLAVWMNHPGLSMIITERDQKALEYLIDIRCAYFTGRSGLPVKQSGLSYAAAAAKIAGASGASNALAIIGTSGVSDDDIGYKLSFDFLSNPYFTDDTLEKSYYYKKGQVDEFGEFLYEKSVGCTIHWKNGMDLTAYEGSKEDGDELPVSFFTFFGPKSLPSESEVDNMTDEDYTDLLDDIEGDFECGGDIRDEIIPYALTYLIDPPQFDDDDSDDDENNEEGEEDGDEDEDDDENEEDSD